MGVNNILCNVLVQTVAKINSNIFSNTNIILNALQLSKDMWPVGPISKCKITPYNLAKYPKTSMDLKTM